MALIASDSFTGVSDGTALIGRVPILGGTWTKHPAATFVNGSAAIFSNRAVGNDSDSTCVFINTPTVDGDFDFTSVIRIVTKPAGVSTYVMMIEDDALNGYSWAYNTSGNRWILNRWNSTTATELATYTSTAPANGTDWTLRGVKVGANIKTFLNGTQRHNADDVAPHNIPMCIAFRHGSTADTVSTGAHLTSLTLNDSTVVGPTNTVPPTVSIVADYEARETHDVTCTTGTWNDATSFSYQWYVAGGDVAGLNTQQITMPKGLSGQTLKCRVSATGPGGGPVAANSSNSIGPIESSTGMIHIAQSGKWRARPIVLSA